MGVPDILSVASMLVTQTTRAEGEVLKYIKWDLLWGYLEPEGYDLDLDGSWCILEGSWGC